LTARYRQAIDRLLKSIGFQQLSSGVADQKPNRAITRFDVRRSTFDGVESVSLEYNSLEKADQS